MRTPLISVIIPTYNRPDYLKVTLESVISQTYKNIEVIVVDDGTPGDENKELCQHFQSVQFVKIENSGGASRPRNKGISMARGEYIAFLDDDDLWVPEKIEKQVSILEQHSEFGLVHSYCKVIDELGNPTGDIIGKPGSPDVKHGDVKMKMIGNWTLMMPTPLVRRSLIEKVGNFNEKMPQAGEDVEYWVRCSFFTKFYYLDEPLAYYRKHQSASLTNMNSYIVLPEFLKKVIHENVNNGMINEKAYNKLLNNLVRMQIKGIKNGGMKTIRSLNRMNPFWFLKFGNIKLLIKKVFS